MKRILFILLLAGCNVPGKDPLVYTKQVEMIPVRDGIKLYTEIYKPENASGDLPFLIKRSPYGMSHDEAGLHKALSGTYKELAEEGFIFVFQDIRGRYQSEGVFEMIRPVRDPEKEGSIDEGTDTFDTIDWLLANIEGHNGKAGQLGISYDGWLTVMSLIEPHPALAATSPQASPADMYIGDDFLHNGALRLSPAFGYAALMESGKTNMPFPYPGDTYDFFLALGPLAHANDQYFNDKLPSWNNFMEHPNYDEYWKRLNVDQHLKQVTIPTLHVAGWWDAEDFYGPMKIYQTLEQYDSEDMNFLVVGPWHHGGWAGVSGRTLGSIDFGRETSVDFKTYQKNWFAYYLKGKGNWEIEEALTFQTGSNQWVMSEMWPPATGASKLYLAEDGKLAEQPSDATRVFTSDPFNPVPYVERPIPGFWQDAKSKYLWKIMDQKFSANRDDVLTYATEPLSYDIELSGEIVANLEASTTGSDADWIVKVIDVSPDTTGQGGFQLMVADEVLRGKFRNSFESPEPLVPGEKTTFRFSLGTRNHVFKKGHRIMVHVQSTWFPLIGRNPQVFVDIPEADEEDYSIQSHTVFGSSYIALPLIPLKE